MNRFDVKSEAEAYDSVICAAEDISLLLEPLEKKLSLSEDQIYAISEHLAFQSEELKLALKQIRKPKLPSKTTDDESATKTQTEVAETETKTPVKKTAKKK